MRPVTVLVALLGLALAITTDNKFDLFSQGKNGWVRANPKVTGKDIYYSAYGNNKWVFLAGGQQEEVFPEVFASSDLKTFAWSPEFNVSIQQNGGALVYGHAGFMVTLGNLIALSQDGVNWSNYTTSFSINTLAYGNGYYVGGSSPMPSTSTPLVWVSGDGRNWKSYTIPLLDQGYYTITFANNSFWVYGYEANPQEVTQALSTTDFVTWQLVPIGDIGNQPAPVNAIFETENNQLIAVVVSADFQVNILGTVANEVWWNLFGVFNMTNPAETVLAVYGNGVLLVWTGSWVATQDFQHFRNITLPYSLSEWRLWDMSFENGMFVATGGEGLIATSSDGLHWSVVNEGFVGDVTGLAYHNGVFSLSTNTDLAENNGIFTSSDGVSWELASSIESGLWSYAYSEVEDMYYGFVDAQLYFSKSNVVSTFQQVTTPLELSSVAVGNGAWVITYNDPEWSGSTGIVMASTDLTGSSWSTSFQNQGPGCPPCRREDVVSNVVFAGGNFYVLSYLTGQLLVSPTGKNWTTETPPCTYFVGPLLSGNEYVYINCISSNFSGYYLLASKDGSNWVPVNDLSGATYMSYSSTLKQYVAINYIAISYSDDGLNWSQPTPLPYTISEVQAVQVVLGDKLNMAAAQYVDGTGANMIYTMKK